MGGITMDEIIKAVEFEAMKHRALAKLPGAMPDHLQQAVRLEKAAQILRRLKGREEVDD